MGLEAITSCGGFFFKTDTRLSIEDRDYLSHLAEDLYRKNEISINILDKDRKMEGRIHTKKEYGLLGPIGGQIFYAEIYKDGIQGLSKLAILIGTKIDRKTSEKLN